MAAINNQEVIELFSQHSVSIEPMNDGFVRLKKVFRIKGELRDIAVRLVNLPGQAGEDPMPVDLLGSNFFTAEIIGKIQSAYLVLFNDLSQQFSDPEQGVFVYKENPGEFYRRQLSENHIEHLVGAKGVYSPEKFALVSNQDTVEKARKLFNLFVEKSNVSPAQNRPASSAASTPPAAPAVNAANTPVPSAVANTGTASVPPVARPQPAAPAAPAVSAANTPVPSSVANTGTESIRPATPANAATNTATPRATAAPVVPSQIATRTVIPSTASKMVPGSTPAQSSMRQSAAPQQVRQGIQGSQPCNSKDELYKSYPPIKELDEIMAPQAFNGVHYRDLLSPIIYLPLPEKEGLRPERLQSAHQAILSLIRKPNGTDLTDEELAMRGWLQDLYAKAKTIPKNRDDVFSWDKLLLLYLAAALDQDLRALQKWLEENAGKGGRVLEFALLPSKG